MKRYEFFSFLFVSEWARGGWVVMVVRQRQGTRGSKPAPYYGILWYRPNTLLPHTIPQLTASISTTAPQQLRLLYVADLDLWKSVSYLRQSKVCVLGGGVLAAGLLVVFCGSEGRALVVHTHRISYIKRLRFNHASLSCNHLYLPISQDHKREGTCLYLDPCQRLEVHCAELTIDLLLPSAILPL